MHKDDFEDYKNRLLSFIIFKIERRYSSCLFLFFFIFFYGRSQIYQKENSRVYITEGTIVTLRNNISGCGFSVNIYIVDGTAVTGLQENIKSQIQVIYLKNKYPGKNVKPAKLKRTKTAVNSEIKDANPKITIKHNSSDEQFLIFKNKFFRAVIPNIDNDDNLLCILKTDNAHLPVGPEDHVPARKRAGLKLHPAVSDGHSIRPPPYGSFAQNLALG